MFVTELLLLMYVWLQSLRGRQDVGVLRELEQWRANVVDVQGVMDEFLMLRNRSNLLRDEVM